MRWQVRKCRLKRKKGAGRVGDVKNRYSLGFNPAACGIGLVSVVAFALVFSGLSCSRNADPGRLLLMMPDCPAQWLSLAQERGIAFSVSRIDEQGRVRLADRVPFGSNLELPAPDSDFAVFLAEPEGTKVTLKPAGALYPLQAVGGSLELDFRRGWTASVAARFCARDPGLAKAFNYARLGDKAAERLEDPWLCPPEALADAAASGRFTLSRVKSRERFELTLLLPGRSADNEGPWLSESPFASAWTESSGLLAASLPPGLSILYRPNERILVSMDEKGKAEALLLPD
jgi:hypothetical protein